MIKKAYVEIGNACFCKCVCCDIHSRPHKIMELKEFELVCRRLHSLGFTQVRLAGNDPLTNRDFCRYVDTLEKLDLSFECTTTLLTTHKTKVMALVDCDDLNISLSAVGSEYEKFFNVKKWGLFDSNMKLLKKYRHKLTTINCTVSRETMNILTLRNVIKYIMSSLEFYPPSVEINFFPAIYYGSESWTESEKFKMRQIFDALYDNYYVNKLLDFSEHKMSRCTIPQVECYVQVDGSVYPCCLSGGELGQLLQEELYLGNIFKDDIVEMHEKMQKPLERLSNPICDRCSQKYLKKMEKIDKVREVQ